MILVERFGIHKHYRNSKDYAWQVVDHEKMRVLCEFKSDAKYKDSELKKLAENVAVHIDELVSTGEINI